MTIPTAVRYRIYETKHFLKKKRKKRKLQAGWAFGIHIFEPLPLIHVSCLDCISNAPSQVPIFVYVYAVFFFTEAKTQFIVNNKSSRYTGNFEISNCSIFINKTEMYVIGEHWAVHLELNLYDSKVPRIQLKCNYSLPRGDINLRAQPEGSMRDEVFSTPINMGKSQNECLKIKSFLQKSSKNLQLLEAPTPDFMYMVVLPPKPLVSSGCWSSLQIRPLCCSPQFSPPPHR